ncbi:MaoC family dehydratase [Alloalcanivorax mobilis]|uniref:MaoC family dehydratase n=1 Tax=Alloalcanivorax mobilis TaxID=2019569 RepID=UPI000B5B10E8|nr:MaoC family dehydratase [Alloalcanivorax mobilis]ASK33565.1 nodulation protein NodN [Alcanivorax sp. N3-2A]|tara:strand:- start:10875 stop:11342 length:468 start_codon:yes stop_codon:yes gene_type:complete
MTRKTIALDDLLAKQGQDIGVSGWHEVPQERINEFADLTADPQWIHIDEARAAKESPFGGTIAHGFLTLSLLSAMAIDVLPTIEGQAMGINYGFDKVRFLNPVRAGSKVRGHFKLLSAERRNDNQVLFRYGITVEIDGVDKPAIACEWLSLAILG